LAVARVDPDYPDQQRAVSELKELTRIMFAEWITSQVGDDPELLAKVLPDYPATGKRTLQDDGTRLRTLKRENVELVCTLPTLSQTRWSPRTAVATTPTSLFTRPGFGQTRCCGRCTSSGAMLSR
jgi:hypothetical protein